ncbi:MAG: TIGR03621 family F420-dependent LLM class oxidoreductase [Streptosporangiaceae bacterium]
MKTFRFAVNTATLPSREEWVARAREAERLGYDLLVVPDHLGCAAPFSAAVAAAYATEHLRVGTFVLNAGFWNPALLAREIATADQLTGGRFEVGIGAGHMKSEFDDAGIPWEGFRERAARLEATVEETKRRLADPDHQPRPAQAPHPPLLVGGSSEPVLRLASRTADIVGLGGVRQAPGEPPGTFRLLDREGGALYVDLVRRLAGERLASLEINALVQRVVITDDRNTTARELQDLLPYLTADQILTTPFLLLGTPDEMADQLLRQRDELGISYISVHEHSLRALAPVIARLAGR